MKLEKDTVISHYKILTEIGKGGMGEVYLAQDTKLNRKVAIKFLNEKYSRDSEKLNRFIQEAQATSALNHPNILTVYGIDVFEGTQYIATEFIEGETLRELLWKKEPVPLKKILKIGIQVAEALAASHTAGIAHRDIKPENIMIRQDGYVKVLDFGLAKLTESKNRDEVSLEDDTKAFVKTSPGSILGTALYMSPEQASGKETDGRTDIWSLGVVLYEMLAGKVPFEGKTVNHTLVQVIEDEPKLLQDVPNELQRIVRKTLAKETEDRYQTARDLLIDLKSLHRDLDIQGELERSISPEKTIGDHENVTEIFEKRPTGNNVEKDRDTNFQSGAILTHSSNLEYVIEGAKTHKLIYSIATILFVGAISAAVYFAYFATSGSQKIDSIAVLPFQNLSDDPNLTYLSDGLCESLIDRLSQLPQLKVIARSSSFKFREKDPDIQDIANQLGVKAIVMGNVVQRGEELTIRVEIIDAIENKQIWGDRYIRKANDILAIQNEIAQKVSEKLSLTLTDNQTKRLANGGTSNSNAFKFYLNGLVEAQKSDYSEGDKALNLFEKAISLDPEFALAYIEIANIYLMRANASGNPHELIPKAKAIVGKALDIDRDQAKAHVIAALIKEYEFDWSGAEAEYKKAIELNQNLEFARQNYAFFLAIIGRDTEAFEQLKQSEVRDPINVLLMLHYKGNILTQARKFDDAIGVFNEMLKLNKGENNTPFSFGYAYAGKGLYEEAGKSYLEAVNGAGGEYVYSQALIYLAATYARIPAKRPESLKILSRLENTKEYVSPAVLAVVYAELGEKERALQLLEKAYVERDLLLRYIKVGYEYDSLRDEPRFKDLLKRMNLAE